MNFNHEIRIYIIINFIYTSDDNELFFNLFSLFPLFFIYFLFTSFFTIAVIEKDLLYMFIVKDITDVICSVQNFYSVFPVKAFTKAFTTALL